MSLQAILSFFTHIPFDWLVLAILALLIAFDAMRGGLSRATALSLALPLTLILLQYVSGAELMGSIAAQFSSPLSQVLFAGIILVIMFILMYRITDTFGTDSQRILQALIAGIATTVVAVVVWLQIPALDTLWSFGGQVQAVFGALYRFWWLLGAYIALAFVRG